MRGRPATSRGDGRRGVSELMSLVILFGLVVSAAAILAVAWSEAGSGVETEIRVESAEVTMEEFDSRLTDVATQGEARSDTLDLAELDGEGERVTVQRDDQLRLWVRTDAGYVPECQVTVPLDEVRYRVTDETSMVYQGGGVLRQEDGSTEFVTAPDVGFSDGTLNVWTVALPDDAGSGRLEVTRNVTASSRTTDQVRRDLFDGEGCRRPDGVKLVVETDHTAAWSEHLREETPDSATVVSTPDEVTVELGGGTLVERADDDRNQVVGFNTSTLPGTVSEHSRAVEIEVDKPDDSNAYDVSTEFLGAQTGQQHLTVNTTVKEIDGSLLRRAANRSEKLQLVTVDGSGRVVGRADVDVTDYVGSGAVIAGVPASLLEESYPVKTDAKGSTCTSASGVDRPTTGPGAAAWVVYNNCGTWKEYTVDPGEPVVLAAATDRELLDDARFEIQEKDGGSWTTLYNHTDALGDDADRTFLFTPESNKIRIQNRGGRGFYMHLYDGLPNLTLKAVEANVSTMRIVHEPVVLRYRLGGGTWESMVGGASPVYRAVNYEEYVVTPPTLADGEPLSTTASFYGCPDHDDQADTPFRTRVPLPSDAFDDDFDLKPAYETDPAYYDHYECEVTTTYSPPADADGYVRGDPVNAAVGDQPAEWQTEFREMVAPHAADIDGDGAEEFALDSNQVIVAFSYDDDGDGAGETNNAVLLYRVGAPHSTSATATIDLTVDVVEFED